MPDEPVMDVDVENVGIMQGFKDLFNEEEEDMDEDEMEMGQVMGRTPDSPEILMNNLRGDMRSIDARRDELADLVGYQAAEETPESVLAMLQPVLAQQGGIGALPMPGAMPPGPPPGMPPGMPPPEMGGMPPPGAMPPGPPPPEAGGIGGLPIGMAEGGEVASNFTEGSPVRRLLKGFSLTSGEPAPEVAAGTTEQSPVRRLFKGFSLSAAEPVAEEPVVPSEGSSIGPGSFLSRARRQKEEEARKLQELQARLAMRGQDYIRQNPQLFTGSFGTPYYNTNYNPLVPTLNMAKGGMVQYYEKGTPPPDDKQDGGVSDEDPAVSVLSNLPSDVQERAKAAFLASIGQSTYQTPRNLPSLSTLGGKYAEEYKNILGSDRKSAQAQLLLELGQRAFGYAANVDEQGRPLKGSQFSRLAGAIRTLPGTVAKYAGEIEKEDRALKLMGLQTAEKERQAIREAGLKEQGVLADLYKEQIKADAKTRAEQEKAGKAAGTPFNQYQNLITPFVQGLLDEPGKIRLINTVTEMVQPTTVTITDKLGNVSTEVRRADIPRSFYQGLVTNYGQEAADKWVKSLGDDIKISPIAYPQITSPGVGTTAPAAATPPAGGGLTVPPSVAGEPATVTAAPAPTFTPQSAQQVAKLASGAPSEGGKPSIWSSRDLIAGPINTLETALVRVLPGMAPNTVDLARQNALKQNEQLIETLAKNEGRIDQGEMNRLRPLIGLTPRIFGSEGAMTTALVSLDDALLRERQADLEILNNQDRHTGPTINKARQRFNAIEQYRATLSVPPRVYENKDLQPLPVAAEYVDMRGDGFNVRRKDTFSFRDDKAIKDFQKANPGSPFAVILPSGKIQLYTTAPPKAK